MKRLLLVFVMLAVLTTGVRAEKRSPVLDSPQIQSALKHILRGPLMTQTNFYFSTSAAGGNNGLDCADAFAYNDGTNGWSQGTHQVAGNTFHVCPGTYNIAANGQVLTTTNAGSSGLPITFIADQGTATFQAPYFSASGGVALSNAYWTFNGDGNLTVQNTLNGTTGGACPGGTCTQNAPSVLFYGSAPNLIVENTSWLNGYVLEAPLASPTISTATSANVSGTIVMTLNFASPMSVAFIAVVTQSVSCITVNGASVAGYNVQNDCLGTDAANTTSVLSASGSTLTYTNTAVTSLLGASTGGIATGFDSSAGSPLVEFNGTSGPDQFIHNTLSWGYTGVISLQSGVEDGWNTFTNCNHCAAIGYAGSGTITGNSIHDFDISATVTWNNQICTYHNDPLFQFNGPASTGFITFTKIYNGYIHGNLGVCASSLIGIDSDGLSAGGFDSTYIFNNVFDQADTTGHPADGQIWIGQQGAPSSNTNVYILQNTILHHSNGGTGKNVYDVAGTASIIGNVDTTDSSCLMIGTDLYGSQYPWANNQNIDYNTFACQVVGGAANAFVVPGPTGGGDIPCFSALTPAGCVGSPAWQAVSAWGNGFDIHGQNVAYTAVNLSGVYVPQSGSAIINFSENLTALCTSLSLPQLCLDKAGNSRPATGNWTAGALNAGGAPNPPINLVGFPEISYRNVTNTQMGGSDEKITVHYGDGDVFGSDLANTGGSGGDSWCGRICDGSDSERGATGNEWSGWIAEWYGAFCDVVLECWGGGAGRDGGRVQRLSGYGGGRHGGESAIEWGGAGGDDYYGVSYGGRVDFAMLYVCGCVGDGEHELPVFGKRAVYDRKLIGVGAGDHGGRAGKPYVPGPISGCR